ncbi:hypothetical protein Y032_0230g2970 [Ancylostoma ceylanicum]|uniref:Uncharacterized protein n=1 Tax=Ancylostoma ceylanicum TaxID=53326 RepID=A0A016SGT3_9BILA|nr:hypothetical protein Y032_0230g2970 [Ancylostoma ceylanicum]
MTGSVFLSSITFMISALERASMSESLRPVPRSPVFTCELLSMSLLDGFILEFLEEELRVTRWVDPAIVVKAIDAKLMASRRRYQVGYENYKTETSGYSH